MIQFYDRQGHPISVEDWEALCANPENHRVATTMIGDWMVSTVLLGLDYNFLRNGPPIIFETMIFEGGSATDLYTDRYPTEEAALAGHDQAVAFLRQRLAEIERLTEP